MLLFCLNHVARLYLWVMIPKLSEVIYFNSSTVYSSSLFLTKILDFRVLSYLTNASCYLNRSRITVSLEKPFDIHTGTTFASNNLEYFNPNF